MCALTSMAFPWMSRADYKPTITNHHQDRPLLFPHVSCLGHKTPWPHPHSCLVTGHRTRPTALPYNQPTTIRTDHCSFHMFHAWGTRPPGPTHTAALSRDTERGRQRFRTINQPREGTALEQLVSHIEEVHRNRPESSVITLRLACDNYKVHT